MGSYINTTGKLLVGGVAASALTEAATGKDTGLARGCLTGLLLWLAWVCLVLGTIYWLAFG